MDVNDDAVASSGWMSVSKDSGTNTSQSSIDGINSVDVVNCLVTSEDCDKSDEFNIAIGHRIKSARLRIGFTQSALSKLIGVSFQQLQKYENGSNRISAEKLYLIAFHLETEISFFFPVSFDLLDSESKVSEKKSSFLFDICGKDSVVGKDLINLVRDFSSVKDTSVRKKIAALVSSIVKAEKIT